MYKRQEEGGQLSEKVRRNPYSVILFDEIEKAHPDVFNILLQVLDDGHITDAQGRKVDFKQTCIIMTSNAGAQNIVAPKRLGFLSTEDERKDYEYMKGQVMEEVKRMFKPEFLNRIDEIIVFHQLTKADMKKILQILLKDLERRCKEQMDIELKVRDTVKEYLVENSFDSKYGARPLKRAIQSKIEDPLAEAILNGEVKKGEPERLKVKTLGVDGFMLGKQNVDLRYIEQLIDSEQTAALGLLLKYTVEHLVDGKRTISETAQWLEQKLEQEGMVFAAEHGVISGGYAIPRIQEIYSCLNRYRV